MKKLNDQELVVVKGGAGFSSAMLNALMRTVSVMFNIGQAVGTAIRRATGRNYC